MTNNAIDRATRELFSTDDRRTRNVRFYFQQGQTSGSVLSDYRSRALVQISRGMAVPNITLDGHLLD